MNVRLDNTAALVTGASRGIGRAIARALAEAGASVALHYNKSRDLAHRLAGELPGEHAAVQADLADTAQCDRLWNEAVERLGRVDVLINNAGIAMPAPIEGDDGAWSEAWERTFSVNARAATWLSRRAVSHWLERDAPGRLIHIASRAAHRGDTPEYLAYGASKAALVATSKTLARYYGKDGIASFAICPGFTRTDMAREFIDRYGEAMASADIALPRMTEPEDIAPMVVLLAPGLADHATGAVIDMNAGSYVR
jgi:NAD(P)-dependent dehydrogenase (short-subunit alcohol dehydrogenase family)